MHVHTISNIAKVIQSLAAWHDGKNRVFCQNVYILIFKMGKTEIYKENVVCVNISQFHLHRRGTMTVYMVSQYYCYCRHNIKTLTRQVYYLSVDPLEKAGKFPVFVRYSLIIIININNNIFQIFKYFLFIQKYNFIFTYLMSLLMYQFYRIYPREQILLKKCGIPRHQFYT